MINRNNSIKLQIMRSLYVHRQFVFWLMNLVYELASSVSWLQQWDVEKIRRTQR